MVLDEEVDVFDGWHVNINNWEVSKKWRKVNLQSTVSDSHALTLALLEYLRQLQHSAESTNVVENAEMILDLLAMEKHNNESNIEYEFKNDGSTQDNAFLRNVFWDLLLQGVSGSTIRSMQLDRRILLLKEKLQLQARIYTIDNFTAIHKRVVVKKEVQVNCCQYSIVYAGACCGASDSWISCLLTLDFKRL